MFEERPSPAKVTAAAAAKLPRWALLALLAAFILPGLLERDPWTLKDAASFGVMWTMAQGSLGDWLLPHVAGAAATESGPLTGWLGAVLIRAFGDWLGAPSAARLSIVVWFAIATSSLWYATWRLARRAEALPVAFAFGGEANARDYGRALADVAVLLLVASFGLVVRLHEAVPDTGLFALAALAFFGLVWSLDRPLAGATLAGAAAGGIVLASSVQAASWILLASLILAFTTPGPRYLRAASALAAAGVVACAWPVAAWIWAGPEAGPWLSAWWQDNLHDFGLLSGEGYVWLARNLAWYTWPLWPVAAWAMYAWRHAWRQPHMLVPLVWLATVSLGFVFSSKLGDSQMMLLVPPLAVLGAFGVSSLRRGAENVIDWFSIAAFTLVGAALWLYFIAWATGWPPKMARSLMRFAPDTAVSVHPLYFLVAVAATVAWAGLVLWRIRRHPMVIWRGPWLAAAGLTMTWMVVVGLFRDAVQTNRDYRQLAHSASALLVKAGATPQDCVQAWQVPAGVRALIAYHGQVNFAPERASGPCRFVLQRDMQRSAIDSALPPGAWETAGAVSARTRPDEVLRILTPQH